MIAIRCSLTIFRYSLNAASISLLSPLISRPSLLFNMPLTIFRCFSIHSSYFRVLSKEPSRPNLRTFKKGNLINWSPLLSRVTLNGDLICSQTVVIRESASFWCVIKYEQYILVSLSGSTDKDSCSVSNDTRTLIHSTELK